MKKLSSCVRPGVFEVRASAFWPVMALSRLDLPTLDLPANATSGLSGGGRASTSTTPSRNSHPRANSHLPAAWLLVSACSIAGAVTGRFPRPARKADIGKQFDFHVIAAHNQPLLQY